MSSLLPIVLLTATVAGHAPVSAAPHQSQKSGVRPAPSQTPVIITASAAAGWIEGVVTDDKSQPVSGAAVTAQGRDLLIIETDRTGRFALRGIPAGTYLLRVQGRGFAASRREFVQVVPSRGTHFDVQLRRAAAPAMAPATPEVMTASVGFDNASTPAPAALPAPASPEPESIEAVPHDHSSAAWRLRHAKRSVLRDENTSIEEAALDDDSLWENRDRFDLADWTVGLGRSAASAVLNGALTGRVQLLTAGTFDQPFEAMTTDDMPAGIAFVHLAGPLSTRTTWSVEAATARGGVSSWFVGGTYATVVADNHGVEVHSSYSRQRSPDAEGVGVYGFEDGRSAGGVAVVDHWTISPRAMLDVGTRYERYDYLLDPGLFSPAITASIAPGAETWIRVTAAREMTAPGAEEFVPEAYGSLSLPPQRTFSPLVPGTPLQGQETRHLGISVERDVASFRLALTHYRQDVYGQLATVFDPGLVRSQRRADLSHYAVANVGDFAASGWGVGVSRPMGANLRGGIEYRMSEVDWATDPAAQALVPIAPSALRGAHERIHDITMRVDAAAPTTGTRVSAACRFNSDYARDAVDDAGPGPGTRFDLQVYQGLPFLNGDTTQVELVFGVRNLIHSAFDGVSSIYDELLVVRPPTRVVGGVTVQF